MTPREQEVTRALAGPVTFDEASRSVQVVIASGNDPGDGIRLAMRREAISTPAVIPVLLDHSASINAMGGRIDPASLRIERGLLVGTAHLSDAPASDQALSLARSGVAASVKASFAQSDLSPLGDGSMLANRWVLRSVALVPEPADQLAVTRSAHPSLSSYSPSMSELNQAPADEQQEETISRSELRRQNAILRACAAAKLPEDFTQELLDSGKTMEEAAFQIVRHQRLKQEAMSSAGHPAQIPIMGSIGTSAPADGLEQVIERAIRGQALAEPLAYTLRKLGFAGGSDEEVLRSAMAGRQRYISRDGGGMMSTSDLPSLLLSTGTRYLQEQYGAPARGIRQLARPRTLTDFREVGVLDVGLVGKPTKILEGGEIKFGSATETAGTYGASRYGLGLSFSFEAMKNDDLGGIGRVLEEFAGAHLSEEGDALAALLAGNGGTAPDGKALFHNDHANSLTAALTVDGLGDAIQKLRVQKNIGGRYINLEPAFLLVGPEMETQGAQLLSDLWRATTPADSNPWRSLQLLVEPSLANATWYLVAGGNRRPFELGQVVGLPRMQQEEDFSTSAYRMKTEHAFGCAVADVRVIVRAVAPSA